MAQKRGLKNLQTQPEVSVAALLFIPQGTSPAVLSALHGV